MSRYTREETVTIEGVEQVEVVNDIYNVGNTWTTDYDIYVVEHPVQQAEFDR
jgi:hypothetical protein